MELLLDGWGGARLALPDGLDNSPLGLSEFDRFLSPTFDTGAIILGGSPEFLGV